MKYLRKFNTEADVMMMVQPNVVLVADTESVKFNVEPPKGAFIQHVDGNLYTADQWTANGFTNDEANGVAVISDNAKFVIAKTSLGTEDWSNDTSNVIEGIMTTTDVNIAKTDYAGEANTVISAATGNAGAAYASANFTFPNGQKGYLPALGEWFAAGAYKSDIDSAMLLIGGTALSNSSNYKIWASTQYDANTGWCFNWAENESSYGPKNTKYPNYRVCRPFTSLNI